MICWPSTPCSNLQKTMGVRMPKTPLQSDVPTKDDSRRLTKLDDIYICVTNIWKSMIQNVKVSWVYQNTDSGEIRPLFLECHLTLENPEELPNR